MKVRISEEPLFYIDKLRIGRNPQHGFSHKFWRPKFPEDELSFFLKHVDGFALNCMIHRVVYGITLPPVAVTRSTQSISVTREELFFVRESSSATADFVKLIETYLPRGEPMYKDLRERAVKV